MSTGVYLAYAIDQATGQRPDHIIRWLGEQPGVGWVYDPGSAFTVNSAAQRSPAIREINKSALLNAGLLVAVLPAGTPSVGVPMEIERAVMYGTPAVVISDAPSWMLQFDDSDRAVVLSEWGPEAQECITRALRGVSEPLVDPGGASVRVRVSEDGETPRRSHEDDAGLDLVVSADTQINPGEFRDVPCGVAVELPSWSWGMITGRSSTLRRRGLMVNQGVIDAGYRGPLFAGAWNLTEEPVMVAKGERIAQLLILENGTRRVDICVVDDLGEGSRGTRGFGSTGV